MLKGQLMMTGFYLLLSIIDLQINLTMKETEKQTSKTSSFYISQYLTKNFSLLIFLSFLLANPSFLYLPPRLTKHQPT